MEPNDPFTVIADVVRMVAAPLGQGVATATGTRLGELVSDRLRMSPQGRAAQASLDVNPPDEVTAEVVQANARTVLHAEVERDPELLVNLRAALDSLTPPATGTNHGISIHGARNNFKGVNVAGRDVSIINQHPLAAWLAIIGLLAVLGMGGYLLLQTTDDAGKAEPLGSTALTQKVVPDEASLSGNWQVTDRLPAEKCPPENDCNGIFAQAESFWARPGGGKASVEVTAFTSEGAASDRYAQIVRELQHERKVDLAQIGAERIAFEPAGSSSSSPEFQAYARTGSVLIKVVTAGNNASVVLPQLLRTSVERADQAQHGKEPNAALS
ncbi:hypothetical protein ABZY44_30500 [Streptomyces sp. NPDC006544]|uniref:hypothetical protein n=1 Tax=Streptomyces sp. NPDC006544 TaxID=3154583 RepID=UPI0033AA1BA6